MHIFISNNFADILTKVVHVKKFEEVVGLLGKEQRRRLARHGFA